MALECVTDVRVFPNAGQTRVVAGGSITFADAISVRFRLIRKNDDSGFFLSFPQSKNNRFDENQPVSETNRKYYDEVICRSKDVYASLLEMVTAEYNSKTNGATRVTQGTGAGAVTEDTPPF